MSSSNQKQKPFQALHDLVAAGDINERLTHAGNFLVHLQGPIFRKSIERKSRRSKIMSPVNGRLFAG
jgi:hypothetical protein